MKRELTIIIAGTFLWCAGFIAAPLTGSELLYRWYSPVCHQFESRSFTLLGEPLAVCIRCTSIYGAFLFMLVLILASAALRSVRVRTVLLLIISASPMAVDGLLTLFSLHESTTISRILTGVLFGGGMALLLHFPLSETIHPFVTKKETAYELKA